MKKVNYKLVLLGFCCMMAFMIFLTFFPIFYAIQNKMSDNMQYVALLIGMPSFYKFVQVMLFLNGWDKRKNYKNLVFYSSLSFVLYYSYINKISCLFVYQSIVEEWVQCPRPDELLKMQEKIYQEYTNKKTAKFIIDKINEKS